MKTKKPFTTRMLSLGLCLVMAAGLLWGFTPTAKAEEGCTHPQVSWSVDPDLRHQHKGFCPDCGETVREDHNLVWGRDATEHWTACAADCGYKDAVLPHEWTPWSGDHHDSHSRNCGCCYKEIGVHTDDDGDLICEVCNDPLCLDEDGDHRCDDCRRVLESLCEDGDNKDHICNGCNSFMHWLCEDADGNHVCDGCELYLSALCPDEGGDDEDILGGEIEVTPSFLKDGTEFLDRQGEDAIDNADGVSRIEAPDGLYVRVSTVDAARGQALAGATVQLLDSVGNPVEEWTATEGIHVIPGLQADTYVLRCIAAPEGYVLPEHTDFSLRSDGKIYTTGMLTEDGTLLVAFEKEKTALSIDISKLDKEYDGKPVRAEYEIRPADGSSAGEVDYNEKVEYKEFGASDRTYTEEAPINAGMYTVRVTVEESDTVVPATATEDFAIEKKAVTVTATAPDKVYDGTTDVDLSSIEIIFNGIVSGETVGVTIESAWCRSINVGTDKVVPIVYRVTGDAAANYAFPEIGEVMAPDYYTEATIDIVAKDISDATVLLGDALTYNGAPRTQTVKKVVTADNLEVTYEVFGNTATNAGVHLLTVRGTGNFTGEAIVVYEIAPETKGLASLTEENVTASDKEAIEAVKAQLAHAETDLADEETKKKYKEIADQCDRLLDALAKAAAATDTENTEKVKDITSENVTPENKTDLEKAKADLEKALAEQGGNYTEDEKKTIGEALKRIEDALAVIGRVEAVETLIDNLPNTVKKDDEGAIKGAEDAYNALSDYEKTLVDRDAKKALDDAKAAFAALSKPSDPTPPNTADSGIFLWISLLFLSVGAMVALTAVGRKRKHSR